MKNKHDAVGKRYFDTDINEMILQQYRSVDREGSWIGKLAVVLTLMDSRCGIKIHRTSLKVVQGMKQGGLALTDNSSCLLFNVGIILAVNLIAGGLYGRSKNN